MYRHAPLYTAIDTDKYVLVRTYREFFCTSTVTYRYHNVLVCTVMHRFTISTYRYVPTSVHTGTYRYVPVCTVHTAINQVYRIPDVLHSDIVVCPDSDIGGTPIS